LGGSCLPSASSLFRGGESYAWRVHQARVMVDVEYDERYWYPDDGGVVWLAGYQLVESEEGRFLARDAPELAERGLRVAGVAGAGRHHSEALAAEDVAPGSPLALRRDPANPHDPNAIAVLGGGGEQVGWVPREVAAELARELDRGEPWSAVVLREQRRSPRDPRTGLTMLLGRAAAIELRLVGARPR
jgi:HIRAN domain